MNRRDFLKSIAAVAAAAYLPALPAGFIHEFPSGPNASVKRYFSGGKQYGNSINMYFNTSQSAADKVKELLISDAKRTLPAGSRYELILGYPSDFGRRQGMTWYSDEKMQRLPVWRNAVFDPEIRGSGRQVIAELIA